MRFLAPASASGGGRPQERTRRVARRFGIGLVSVAGVLGLIIVLALALPGCAVGYVTRQSVTHLRVLAARQPVDKAIAAGKVPEDWLPKIEIIRDAKTFGTQQLALPAEDLYETISLVRPGPTWIVTAVPKDSLEPITWWFPIVGRVGYRGYYDREDAERFATRLRHRDLDVLVAPAAAFSTLGWFSDPIRPSMLEGREPDLANLVLHEAAHRLLYLKGRTDFNEAFASFVGDEATLVYLEDRHGPDCPLCRETADEYADAERFGSLVGDLLAELRALYSGPSSRDDKLRRREEVFRHAQRAYEDRPWRTGRYEWFPERQLDNAVVLSLVRYAGRQEPFRKLLARCDGDLLRALMALTSHLDPKHLSRRQRRIDPFERLELLLESRTPCPTDAGS